PDWNQFAQQLETAAGVPVAAANFWWTAEPGLAQLKGDLHLPWRPLGKLHPDVLWARAQRLIDPHRTRLDLTVQLPQDWLKSRLAYRADRDPEYRELLDETKRMPRERQPRDTDFPSRVRVWLNNRYN